MAWLNQIAWLICIVYSTIPLFWLLIHPRAEYWRSRTKSPYRVLLPVWLALWLLFGIATWHWRRVELYSSRWPWVPAVLLFAIGVWLYVRAGAHFSWEQLGGLPELLAGHPDQRLVTTGLRAWVRHPVYLGHLCEMLAWSVASGLIVCYGLTAWALLSGAVMIQWEDAELEKRFGPEYISYREATPAVIPRLRR
jgi:protein-S-isoprenylcysteine O-methyltransferase Ste14